MKKEDLERLVDTRERLQRIKTEFMAVHVSLSLTDSKYPALTSPFSQTRVTAKSVQKYQELLAKAVDAEHATGMALVEIDAFINAILDVPDAATPREES